MRERPRLARLVLWTMTLVVPASLWAQGGPRPGRPTPQGRPFMDLVGVQDALEAKTVKGAPYQAETITEIVQALADGNRIVQRTTGAVFRDREGRTRRESAVGGIGPLMPEVNPPRVVLIFDPVAGAHYRLDPAQRVAHRLPPRPAGWRPPLPPREDATRGPRPRLPEIAPIPVSESLGRKTMEGLEVDGTRETVTIPAGEIGNEKPIYIVNERWYSPDLQVVVRSTRSDPRLGVTSFRLAGVKREEPDRSTFVVPEDYRITDDAPPPPGPRRRPGPPEE